MPGYIQAACPESSTIAYRFKTEANILRSVAI